MKIYLAGFKTIQKIYPDPTDEIFLLSSFFEHKNGKFHDYVYSSNHILDSGAFSFFGGKKTDWNKYVDDYCNFINKTNQKLFFELDIDLITSLEFAETLRKKIEDKTGKQPIPVWRPSRGIDYWNKMCEEYNYIAISASGNYDSAWTRNKKSFPAIQKMLSIAKKNNTKVHGLGFTSIPSLKYLKFDSVDSTTWLNAKYGEVHQFKGEKIIKHNSPNVKLKNSMNTHLHNFKQWVKFQKYADANL